MPNIDFEQEFSLFCGNTESSAIKDIYAIIPTMDNSQMRVILSLNYFIQKYQLDDLKKYVEEYIKLIGKNKNLNFVRSMNVKNLLKAYTQEELIKGIKINSQNVSRQGE